MWTAGRSSETAATFGYSRYRRLQHSQRFSYLGDIVRKIHADLLAKIQAEPEKKFQILVRFPREWYEKVGQYTSKEFLFDSIKAIFGFWDRRFGNIVFLDFES